MTNGKLLSGQQLRPEHTLVSVGGQARLHYQGDGNLVVYLDGLPVWASHTEGYTAGHLTMRRDGNLVISDGAHEIASTNTHDHPGAMVQLQDDGNFVIYEDPDGPLAGTPLWASATSKFQIGDVVPSPTGHKTRRPLIGPLRIQNKLLRDDSGYRRVFFASYFTALRILRDSPSLFYRDLDAVVAAGYQGIRVFFAVGGWSTYWDGREVAPITFKKWHHSRESGLMRPASHGVTIEAWPDYDLLLRTLLRECHKRGLRVIQSVGDMQIICPDAGGKQKELDLNRRFARICREEGGPEVIALAADTNEYPQNRYASDSPESVDQMGRIIQAWRQECPGVLTTMGAAISEEPDRLYQSITHGDVCGVHPSRDDPPYTLKRTHALVHWEGAYRHFPKPYWALEPMGWGPEVSVQRFYNPQTNADGVAVYAMHHLLGMGSTYFNGASIQSKRPLDGDWGFYELPALFDQTMPEDIATWDHGNSGRGIEFWWKDQEFRTASHKSWPLNPPRPVAEWTLYDGGTPKTGTGTPPNASGYFVGKFK